MKDCRGIELKIGDTVVHANGSKRSFLQEATIHSFTPQMVRIINKKTVESKRGYDYRQYEKRGYTAIVTPECLAKV